MAVLQAILDRYLSSADFNGLVAGDLTADEIREVRALVYAGEVQIVTEADFPNMHIRAWRTARTVEDQVRDLDDADRLKWTCLYPTAQALAVRLDRDHYSREPYKRRLAEGEGQLDLAYFTFDVLETYRNDPRFNYRQWDFGLDVGASSEIYERPDESNRDKISTMRVGFAYSAESLETPDVVRRACVILRDLSALTPEHQRRWETYEVSNEGVFPHPQWLMVMRGEWATRVGPFERFLAELEAANDLFEGAFGVPLLSSVTRPVELGWVLRPSKEEWWRFIQVLDKLLSDNLRSRALDAAGVPARTDDGTEMGTLQRLERFLIDTARVPPDQARAGMAPLRRVRKERHTPAHALTENLTDRSIVREQAELLRDVTESLFSLRSLLESHPRNRDWTRPTVLDEPSLTF